MLFQKSVKIGEILRNRSTRHCFLVVHKTTQGLFVINLMLSQAPRPLYLIVPGEQDRWDRDTEIDDLDDWEKNTIERQLPMINAYPSPVGMEFKKL